MIHENPFGVAVLDSVFASVLTCLSPERARSLPRLVQGASLTTSPNSPRSLGGWGNRTCRRKAQDEWQPSLIVENNELGWGASGYKPYIPKEIKVEVPKNCVVGSSRKKKVAVSEDPEEAKAQVKAGIGDALRRLNLNPLVLYNLSNKKKNKFITKAELAQCVCVPSPFPTGRVQFWPVPLARASVVPVVRAHSTART